MLKTPTAITIEAGRIVLLLASLVGCQGASDVSTEFSSLLQPTATSEKLDDHAGESPEVNVLVLDEGPRIKLDGIVPDTKIVVYRILPVTREPFESAALRWYDLDARTGCVSKAEIREPMPNEGGRVVTFVADQQVVGRSVTGELIRMSPCGPEAEYIQNDAHLAECDNGIITVPSPAGERIAVTRVLSQDQSGVMLLSTTIHEALGEDFNQDAETSGSMEWRIDEREGGVCGLSRGSTYFGWINEHSLLIGDRLDGPPTILYSDGRQQNAVEVGGEQYDALEEVPDFLSPWQASGIDIAESDDFALILTHRGAHGLVDKHLLIRGGEIALDIGVDSNIQTSPDGRWVFIAPMMRSVQKEQATEFDAQIISTKEMLHCPSEIRLDDAEAVVWGGGGLLGVDVGEILYTYREDSRGCLATARKIEVGDNVESMLLVDERSLLIVRKTGSGQRLEVKEIEGR